MRIRCASTQSTRYNEFHFTDVFNRALIFPTNDARLPTFCIDTSSILSLFIYIPLFVFKFNNKIAVDVFDVELGIGRHNLVNV